MFGPLDNQFCSCRQPILGHDSRVTAAALTTGPVTSAVRGLADGTVTSAELVMACLADPHDAIVPADPNTALAEAHDADRRRAAGACLPLLGLPVAVHLGMHDHPGPRAAGAIVVGATYRTATALTDGACAVLGRPGAGTVAWRPAGSATLVHCRDAADLSTLGPLLGVRAPFPDRDRLGTARIGVRGWGTMTLTAATRLSLAGLDVTEVDRREAGRMVKAGEPSAGVDLLIVDGRRPVALTHASVHLDDITLVSRRDGEDLLLAVAAMLGQLDAGSSRIASSAT
jgi:hypothetical protein